MQRGVNVFNNALNNLRVPAGAAPTSWSTVVRDGITTSSPSVDLYNTDGKLHMYTGAQEIFEDDIDAQQADKVDGSLVAARAAITSSRCSGYSSFRCAAC